MKIKALLLAAGLGTRLRPLTLDTPKCLVEIDGIPLLGIWLEKLNNLGCDEVLINTHYLNEKVENYLSNLSFKNMEIKVSYEQKLLGTAGTLINNAKFFNDEIGLLIHADNFTNDNLSEFIKCHLSRPKDCFLTMLTFKTDNPSSCGIVEKDNIGRITKFYEKSKEFRGSCANGAIYAFDQDFMSYLKKMTCMPYDFSIDIIPNLLGKIFSYHTKNVYLDIGNYDSYSKANEIAKKNKNTFNPVKF